MSKRITLTTWQMTHQWFFMQFFFPKELREEILAAYMNNRDRIDAAHDMEILVPCES